MRRLAIGFISFAASVLFAHAEPLQVSIPPLHRDGVTLTGYFLKPVRSAASGGSPAVVLMHGCGGPITPSGRIRARERAWMERLARAGYSALLVDSFNPRGVRSTCGSPTKGLSSVLDRPFDAYAALAWLRARRDIDGGRIALMGWSHGGESVLSTASQRTLERLGISAPGGFVTLVAFYPGCQRLLKAGFRAAAPLLVHLGQADDWTPIKACEELVRTANEAGGDIRAFVYPGAHHGFDQPAGEVRQRKLVSGRVVSSGADPAARELAIERTMATFEKALGQ
jgi:dienelactone hydrolase